MNLMAVPRLALAAIMVALSVAASGCAPPGAVRPTAADLTRSEQWRAIAVQALDAYELTGPPPSFKPFIDSQAMLAIGRLYGWDDPRIQPLISDLMALRNPDGGWGIGVTRNGLSGTGVNPATTTYTVTLAGHVGPALLAANKAGVFNDPADIQVLKDVTHLLMTTGQLNTTAGSCVAYSRSSYDLGGANLCVHNVNAGVADYLTQASAAGFGYTGLQKLVVAITRREVTTYNISWSNWSYREGQATVQDEDHGSYSAESMYFAAYPVGREAAYQLLAAAASDNDGRRAHMRIVGFPGGPGSQGLVNNTTTLWCEMGDAYLAEATAYVTSVTDAQSLSQAAALASKNATVC